MYRRYPGEQVQGNLARTCGTFARCFAHWVGLALPVLCTCLLCTARKRREASSPLASAVTLAGPCFVFFFLLSHSGVSWFGRPTPGEINDRHNRRRPCSHDVVAQESPWAHEPSISWRLWAITSPLFRQVSSCTAPRAQQGRLGPQ